MTEKKLEDMTQIEKIEYWKKVREEEELQRENKIRQLSEEQRDAIVKLHKELNAFLLTACHPDMGGIRAITAVELQDLEETLATFRFQFNLAGIT